MSGKSNIKWKATMIAKYGSEEALSAHQSENALKAQKSWEKNNRKPRGFAYLKLNNKEQHKAISSKGGIKRKENYNKFNSK